MGKIKNKVWWLAEWIILAIAVYFLIKKLGHFSISDIAIFKGGTSKIIVPLLIFFFGWVLNILLEAQNWKIVQRFLRPITFKTAFFDNLHAYALNFVSPMMSGEFIARHRTQHHKKDKKRSIFLGLWMHWPKLFSKFIATCLASTFIIPSKFIPLSLSLAILLTLIYFNFRKILNLLGNRISKLVPIESIIFRDRPYFPEKVWLLINCVIRIIAYTAEMAVAIYIFNGSIANEVIILLPVYVLTMAFIPNIQAVGFALNSFVAILLLEKLIPAETLTLAATTVWFFNIAIPSVAGMALPYLRPRYRLIRKKD